MLMQCSGCDVANAPMPYIEDTSVSHQLVYGNVTHSRFMPLNKVVRAHGNSSVEIVINGTGASPHCRRRCCCVTCTNLVVLPPQSPKGK